MVPLVSVIIPTYNRAALVREAVASVTAQTFQDFEIVLVDDGSTDETLEALAHWEDITVLRQTRRRGVAAARNLGAAAARGEWLAFLDSDDLWLPEKLARQMAYLEDQPGLRLCQTDETWVRRGVRVNKPVSHRKVAGRIFLPSLERCMVSPSAVVLQRRLFLQTMAVLTKTLPAAEDYDLWLRLTWRFEVGLVDEPLIIKRGGHADQLSGQWGIDRFRIRALIKLLGRAGPARALCPGGPPDAGGQMRHLRPGLRKAGEIRRSPILPESGRTAGGFEPKTLGFRRHLRV